MTPDGIRQTLFVNISPDIDTTYQMELDNNVGRYRTVGNPYNSEWRTMRRIKHETICNFHGRVLRAFLKR